MKNNKKFRSVLAIAAALVISSLSSIKVSATQAQTWPGGIEIADSGESATVIEEQTGTVLYAKNADEVHYPASITKVMTALLALENTKLDETVTYSKDSIYNVERGSSSIGRDIGEKMSMEECLYGMMLESCNNTAYAIAEHTGGTYDNFIKMMNDKALSLGCTNTHFANPNGLPDENHYTSAHDMALIARAAYMNEDFRRICGTGKYTIPPTNKHSENTYLRNHHQMLYPYKSREYLYDYCKGGKTGYTTVARNTLVTYAEKDGMTLVCVVMNAGPTMHYKDTRSLLDYCFDNFAVTPISGTGDVVEGESLSKSGVLAAGAPPMTVDDSGVCVLPKNATMADTERTLVVASSATDPDQAGYLQYSYAGHNVGLAVVKYSDAKITNQQGLVTGQISETVLGDGQEEEKTEYIRINPLYIVLIVLLIIAAILVVILLIRRSMNPHAPRKRRTHYSGRQSGSGYTEIKNRVGGPAERAKSRKKSRDFTSTDIHSDNFIRK